MSKYFAQGTAEAELECLMMQIPGFRRRGSGTISSASFRYTRKDVDCRYCLYFRRDRCTMSPCPYIKERIEAGVITETDEEVER